MLETMVKRFMKQHCVKVSIHFNGRHITADSLDADIELLGSVLYELEQVLAHVKAGNIITHQGQVHT